MDVISDFLGGTRYFGFWYAGSNIRYGNQFPVKSRSEVVKYIEKYNGAENCGISISTFKDNVPFLLYLPSDFDSNFSLHDAWSDAKMLYNFLVDCGYKVSIVYSGRKGFHVILKVKPYIYTRRQLREIQMFFKKYLKLKTLDNQIMGDIRRIIRIPGTYNSNGNLCRVVAESDGSLFDLRDFTEEIAGPVFDFKSDRPLTIYHEYPCILKYISDKEYWIENHERHKFEPHWLIRFSYVIEKLAEDTSLDEIVDSIEKFGWEDFNRDKTKYFIEHIARRGYYHPSCETIQEFGFCLKNCKYRKEFNPRSKNGKM